MSPYFPPDEAKKGIELAAGQTSQLARNQYAHHAEEAYKVWPTNDDRAAFSAVMDSDVVTGLALHDTRMADAYAFFRAVILAWLTQEDLGQRALAFAAALKDHLRLIVLDLDESDEPQAIFETLNAHGTPLLPADLMKNWLLWQASKQELDSNQLYQDNWSKFDRDHLYWRKVVGAGHAARPRIDTFLQNWLTVATTDNIAVKHLYDRFLAYANEQAVAKPDQRLDVPELMAEIAEHSRYYALVDMPHGDTRFDQTLKRLNRLDFVVFRPVLMALLSRYPHASEDAARGAQALESFLVRRMVCDLQTRGYGTLALELVRVVKDVTTGQQATPALVEALSAAPGGWPDNAGFKHNWRSRRFYGWFRRNRVAMILQALEERYQANPGKSEPVRQFDYAKLQIEHIMPQNWGANWPLAEGQNAIERDILIQNIGNLTLVSDRLNASLSNSKWFIEGSSQCKSAQLGKHSDVRLNKHVLAEHPTWWSEEGIKARADHLFEEARQIWPAPSEMA